MLVAFTNERSPRVKNFWYWYVGVAVSDQAALPGPYIRLRELEALLPLLEMYSKRPAIDHPFFKALLARIAPPQVALCALGAGKGAGETPLPSASEEAEGKHILCASAAEASHGSGKVGQVRSE